MDTTKELNLDFLRRFGVEIEVNSFDMRSRPANDSYLPDGIHYIGNLVRSVTNDSVLIHKWGHDHHNDCWIVKPDGSCGMEVCTPVLKGWRGLIQVCRVVDGLNKDIRIKSDERCSFHVHVDVSDLSVDQLASVISWWIKCEAVFMDAMPANRKRNQYCQLLGQTDMFENVEDGLMSSGTLLKKVGLWKYYSINTYHYQKNKRKTIEFRIMDNECCLDSWMTKNWIRLVLYFVERAVNKGLPLDYELGNKWTGYSWLDPIDVFDFLGFTAENNLSAGLTQVRNWFLGRLHSQGRNTNLNGIMSDSGRRIAIAQVDELILQNPIENIVLEEDIYSDKFRI